MSDEVKINDSELEGVAGGAGSWKQYAKGTYVNYGSYIVYTVASGDVLSLRRDRGPDPGLEQHQEPQRDQRWPEAHHLSHCDPLSAAKPVTKPCRIFAAGLY